MTLHLQSAAAIPTSSKMDTIETYIAVLVIIILIIILCGILVSPIVGAVVVYHLLIKRYEKKFAQR